MKHSIPLKQVSKPLKLVALLICALSACLRLGAAQALPTDNSASHAALCDELQWDNHTVEIHKKTLPTYLRNRKIKHYAIIAALGSCALGYAWYINQPTQNKLPEISSSMKLNQENFSKTCEVVGHIQPKHAESCFHISVGSWKIPCCPKPEAIAQSVKSLAIFSLANLAIQKTTSIFSFREDTAWFYNEEKHIAAIGKHLEAQALNLDAAIAAKQPEAIILLKKQILLENAHHYVDCLMALYVFMENRSAHIVAHFEPEIREKLQQRLTLQTASVMQNGIDFCQKLNDAVAKTAQSPVSPTETARAIVMQTHNLMQAVVDSFVRLEDLYNK